MINPTPTHGVIRMQRLIRSFNTLTDQLKEKLQEQYPDGVDSSHIRTISTAKGESLRVIELRTSDAIYLIKINPESRAEIDEFLDQEDGAPAGAEDLGGDDIAGDADGADEDTGDGDDDADDEGEEEEDADEDADEDAEEEDDEEL